MYNRYKHKKEKSNRNITLIIVIKPKEKWTKDIKGKQIPINKMTRKAHLSIITLDINGLNSPAKDRMAEWIRNKTWIYTAYKKLTSDLETHTKWGDWKIYSNKWKF